MPSTVRLAYSRRERKFPLPAGAWNEVVGLVERQLPLERFDGVHETARIRTTYLDTDDLASFREYERREPIRKKVRIRQYGYNSEFDGTCWVEMKIKRYRQSLKRRFCCSSADLPAFMDGGDIEEQVLALNSGSVEAAEIYHETRALVVERSLRPVVIVEYDRVSFQDGASSGARVTVDRNIRFSDSSGSGTSEFDGIVLELKHSGSEPEEIRKLIRTIKLSNSARFSKFARAVMAVDAQATIRRCSA